jgi:hypothetical protein
MQMPIEKSEHNTPSYLLISFDEHGVERTDDPDGLMSAVALSIVRSEPITDIFVFSHGWKGDVPSARTQYRRWLGVMGGGASSLKRALTIRPGFRPLIIGLHWPSQPWGDEGLNQSSEISFAAGIGSPTSTVIDTIVEDAALRLVDTPRSREALRTIFLSLDRDSSPDQLPSEIQDAYEDLDRESGLMNGGVGGAPGADREQFDPAKVYRESLNEGGLSRVNFGGGVFGALLDPLRVLSFWKMKDRARVFGERGGFEIINALQQNTDPSRTRFHLMGHSFGCVVVSSIIAGVPNRSALPRPVDSLALIQGALSHWSYCSSVPGTSGQPGYYHRILAERKVRGPIITTQSRFDLAIGVWYQKAAGIRRELVFDPFNPHSVDDSHLPKYGGLGSFGARGSDVSAQPLELLNPDADYALKAGTVYNFESSRFIREGGGISGAHSDIAHPEVANAVWQAALAPTN